MLSTSHTLLCPNCGQQATVRVHTVRHRRATQRDGFEPQFSFTCRNRCTLELEALEAVRRLSGVEAATA